MGTKLLTAIIFFVSLIYAFSDACSQSYRLGSGPGDSEGFSDMQEAGFRWTRLAQDFKDSDITGGVPSSEIIQQFDVRIQSAQSKDFYVLGILNPRSENDVWPSSVTMAAVFKFFVERYDGDGNSDFEHLTYPVVYWEICNEYESNPVNPDDPDWHWKGLSEAEYLEYCVKSKEALKDAYSSGLFSAGSIVERPNDGFKNLINNGFTPDFISFHGYSPTDFCTVDGRSELSALSASLDSIPLIITECAFYGNSERVDASQVKNAKWLPMALCQAFNLNTELIIYAEFAADSTWDDDRLLWMTMIDKDGVKRPNYYTFKKLNETIGQFSSVSKIESASGTNLYKFDLGGGRFVYIGWTDATGGGTIEVSSLSGCDYVTVTNTVPNTTSDVVDDPLKFTEGTVNVASGKAQVAVTSDIPVYIAPHSATYTITASAGSNGSISPSGDVAVGHGESQTFTITPNDGYYVSDVLVDDANVGSVETYTFSNVTANHTISVTFAAHSIVYVSAGDCGGNDPCYATLEEAVSKAPDHALIKVAAESFKGDVLVDADKTFTFEWGYDDDFETKGGVTEIEGTFTARDNTIIKSGTIRAK